MNAALRRLRALLVRPDGEWVVAPFALATLFVGTWLAALQGAFALDGSASLDAFLAAPGACGADIHACRAGILERWRTADVTGLPWLALLVDLVVFIPAYAGFLVTFARALGRRLRGERRASVAAWLSVAPERPTPGPAPGPGPAPASERFTDLGRLLLVATLALVAADLAEDGLGLWALGGAGPGLDRALHVAHAVKCFCLWPAGVLATTVLVAWLFDIGAAADDARHATLRRDIADVCWRSRYTVGFIAFFGVLTLGLPQGRDVVVGIASGERALSGHQRLAILASVAATWLFAYACYLWPRILLRTCRPGTAVADGASPASQVFAQWVPRLLGTSPMLMLTWLCGEAAHDAILAGAHGGSAATARAILACGSASLLLAVAFCGVRAWVGRASDGPRQGYLDVVAGDDALRHAVDGPYRLLVVVPNAPVMLLPLSLALVAVVRFWSLHADGEPLALAAIGAALALWSGVAGQVAALALRQATPWMLFGVVLSGVLGALGWTDNHVVPTYTTSGAGLSVGDMLAAALALAVLLLGYGLWLLHRARRPAASSRLVHAVALGTLVGSILLTMTGADVENRQPDATRASRPAARQADLDDALGTWLAGLCARAPACQAAGTGTAAPAPSAASAASAAQDELRGYVVYAEGGGIRAAYWTALALAALTRDATPDFPRRTFAISSVSGGSIGAATYRGCLDTAMAASASASASAPGQVDDDLQDCVERLGSTDLLTPLISAWLFEDVMSRFVPVRVCRSSGCGFMSRGLWFEQAFEAGMARPLHGAASAALGAPLDRGVGDLPAPPRLFLNATVVESGERAIASDVAVAPPAFADAHDQQGELHAPLKLSSAAHNSARFPFVNAIGLLRSAAGTSCTDKAPAVDEKSPPPKAATPRDCLHLADGGYFDNSGAQTAQDIVQALDRLLQGPVPQRAALDAARWQWLRRHLRMTAFFIEFDEHAASDPHKCSAGSERNAVKRALAGNAGAYRPQAALDQGPLKLYTDLVGPAVTAKNAGGTGAGGRLAESRMVATMRDFDTHAGVADLREPSLVLPIELRQCDTVFPLGWYLSPQSRADMQVQAGMPPRTR